MACEFSVIQGIDLGACAKGVLLGWVPPWVWEAIGWLPWVLWGLGGLLMVVFFYRVYRLGGWPGLSVAIALVAGAGGYIAGRRAGGKRATPQPVQRKEVLDIFGRRGAVPTSEAEKKPPTWFQEVTGNRRRGK